MTTQSEKDLTQRVSKIPTEEVYTNLDVNRNIQTNENIGYTFEFPPMWLNEFGANTMISVRKRNDISIITCYSILPSF
jgi:hypothetical protein